MWLSKPPLGTQIDWAHTLARGLIGYFPFNENFGNLIKSRDTSRNSRVNMIDMSDPPTSASGWNPGRNGMCLNANGTSNYFSPLVNLDTGQYSEIETTDEMSISCRIKSSTDWDGAILGNASWTPVAGIYFGMDNLNVYFGTGDGATKFNTSVAHGMSINIWYHIVVTANITTIKIYKNGGLIKTQTGGTITGIDQTGVNVLYVFRPNGVATYFEGSLDDLFVWNRVLTDNEVLQLCVNPYILFEDASIKS